MRGFSLLSSGRPSRRTAIAAGVVVAGVATVTALWLGSPSQQQPAASAPQPKASLPGRGDELVALINGGKSRTYGAQYRTTSGTGATKQNVTLEISQKPPRKRETVVMAASGKSAKAETYLLPDRTVSCEASQGGPWTCATRANATATGFDNLATQIADLGATSVARAADQKIAGLTARCYRIQAQKVTADVCVTPDGIPAKVAIGPSKFELVKITPDVADSVFTPPV